MNKIKYLIIVVAVLASLLSGCDDFGDMNKNPNAPTSIENNPELLLTYLTRNLPETIAMEGWSDGSSLMAQYNAKIVFTGFDLFDWGSNAGYWSNLYTYARNCNNLEAIGHNGHKAISQTLKAVVFHQLVDNWGDVPYSEALQAKTEKNYTPKYDKGEDIYLDLVKKLDEANTLYSNNTAGVVGDVLNDNDLTLWRKFNNSLMLRLYMRMSEVKPDIAKAGIAKILADPGKYPILSSSTENVALTYFEARPNTWPVHTSRVGSFDENRMSETIESVLKAYDDTRMKLWFRPTSASVSAGNPEWAGMKNGLSDGVAYNYKGGSLNLSRWGEIFFEYPNASESILMLHSEVEFIIAEAIQRGWTGGDQKTHYENAIKSSFDYWNSRAAVMGQSLEMPAGYLSKTWAPKTDYNKDLNVNVAYDGSLAQIIIQKWISHIMVAYEGFNDYKRLGIPNIIKPGPDAIYSVMPNRHAYPSEEQALNGANRAEAAGRLQPNGDDIRSKVFWQK